MKTLWFPKDGLGVWDGNAQKLGCDDHCRTKNKQTNKKGHKEKGHYLIIKGSVQENIILDNIYATNIGTPKYIKQILTDIKREFYGNTIIVGDFNTPHTSTDRSSRQKINKATEILSVIIEELDFFFFFLSTAASVAYGNSQSGGQIRAGATGLHHSHSNTRSEPHLSSKPQLAETWDP